MKIVVNRCHGGFGLSDKAALRYAEIRGFKLYPETDRTFGSFTIYWKVPPSDQIVMPQGDAWYKLSMDERVLLNELYNEQVLTPLELKRDDPALVQVVEELGDAANGFAATLKVVEIPDDVKWQIEEYDGNEHVAEQHRTWY